MDDMQVYIANLGKYNEGELVGAWFTFPIDFEEVKEKIGLNDEYEEYAIHDYELPFTVDEYTSIGELNRLWEMVSELPEELQSELSALLTHFSSIEELSEHQEDIIIHSDCDDMYDVARYYIEETGALGEVPASLQNYIDYQAYGRDLDLSGTFISTNHGIFENDMVCRVTLCSDDTWQLAPSFHDRGSISQILWDSCGFHMVYVYKNF